MNDMTTTTALEAPEAKLTRKELRAMRRRQQDENVTRSFLMTCKVDMLEGKVIARPHSEKEKCIVWHGKSAERIMHLWTDINSKKRR